MKFVPAVHRRARPAAPRARSLPGAVIWLPAATLLGAVITFAGCSPKSDVPPQPATDDVARAADEPAAEKPAAEDPDAIAALEQANYLIERDSDGVVTAVAVASDSDISDTFKHLAGLPNITEARLSGPGIEDQGLDVLAELNKLKRLDLSDSAISDETLTVVAKLPGLQVLRLRRVGVTDEGLQQLEPLQNLRMIDLRNTNIGDAGMRALAKLKSLADVQLEKSKITDAGVRELVGLPLKSFNANYCTSLGDETLKAFGQIPTLEQIQLDYTKISDEGMAHLAGLKNLKRLRIRGCDVTGKGIREIADASQMARMELRDTSVDDEGLAVIAKFPKLTFLDLGECRLISADGIKQLAPATGLTYAGFWETKLNDQAFKALDGWVNLVELDLKSTDISDESIDTILKFKKLENLNMAGVQQVTDEGFTKLGQLPNLKSINVANTQIGYDALDALEAQNEDLQIIEYEN